MQSRSQGPARLPTDVSVDLGAGEFPFCLISCETS